MSVVINRSRRIPQHIVLPILFILMWASGYPAGKFGLMYAGPYSLLFYRFLIAGIVMTLISVLTKARWPNTLMQYLHLMLVGLLMQGVQFAAVYYGMSVGVSAGVTALIIGIMPILTALMAGFIFHEAINVTRGFGAVLGLIGVGLVVNHELLGHHAGMIGYLAIALALISVTLGAMYQKYFCVNLDLRTSAAIQLMTACVFVLLFAWHDEGFKVHWQLGFIESVTWLSLVNSIGAFTILFILLKRGEASKVSSLFHLIPGTAAIMSYFVLGETLSATAMIGFVITGAAVYLSH